MVSENRNVRTSWVAVVLIGLACVCTGIIRSATVWQGAYNIMDSGIDTKNLIWFNKGLRFIFPSMIVLTAIIFFRVKRRYLITAGLSVSAIGAFIASGSSSDVSLSLGKIIMEAGNGVVYCGAIPLVFDYIEKRRIHLGYEMFFLICSLSESFSFVVSPLLVRSQGILRTYTIFGAMGIGFVLLSLLIREVLPGSGDDYLGREEAKYLAGKRPEFIKMLFSPAVLFLLAANVVTGFCICGIVDNLYLYAEKYQNIEFSYKIFRYTIVIALGLLMEGIIIAVLADRLRRDSLEKPLYIGVVSLIFCIPFVFILFALKSRISFQLGQWGYVAFAGMGSLPVTILMLTLVEARARSLIYGINSMVVMLVNRLAGTFLSGRLTESYGLESTIKIFTCFIPVAVVLLLLAIRSVPKDYERLKKRLKSAVRNDELIIPSTPENI